MSFALAASAMLTMPAGALVQTMMWAGHERQYYVYVPESTPTGLIVALSPDEIDGVQKFCESGDYGIGNVGPKTGALVVCPAARVYNNSGPGHPGGPNPCWKSFVNYGYCTGGRTTEDSEDVEFLVALIDRVKREHRVPEGRTVMSGISNGGSGAYRFNCEKSEMIDGLVIGIQSWFDPWVGYFDYVNHVLPTGTPQCQPKKRVPLYSADGREDPLYGQPPCFPGFEAVANWENYSTQILGCTGERRQTTKGPHDFPQGAATCYEYPSCSGIVDSGLNVMCSVAGMGHDGSSLGVLLPAAFQDFFGSKPLDSVPMAV